MTDQEVLAELRVRERRYAELVAHLRQRKPLGAPPSTGLKLAEAELRGTRAQADKLEREIGASAAARPLWGLRFKPSETARRRRRGRHQKHIAKEVAGLMHDLDDAMRDGNDAASEKAIQGLRALGYELK